MVMRVVVYLVAWESTLRMEGYLCLFRRGLKRDRRGRMSLRMRYVISSLIGLWFSTVSVAYTFIWYNYNAGQTTGSIPLGRTLCNDYNYNAGQTTGSIPLGRTLCNDYNYNAGKTTGSVPLGRTLCNDYNYNAGKTTGSVPLGRTLCNDYNYNAGQTTGSIPLGRILCNDYND